MSALGNDAAITPKIDLGRHQIIDLVSVKETGGSPTPPYGGKHVECNFDCTVDRARNGRGSFEMRGHRSKEITQFRLSLSCHGY